MLVSKVFDLSFSHNKNICLVILPSQSTPHHHRLLFSLFSIRGRGILGAGCYKMDEALQLPPRSRRAVLNEGEFVGRLYPSNKIYLLPVVLMLHAEHGANLKQLSIITN
jgi:hypothetical protein